MGNTGCGKSSVVKALAKLAEKPLRTLPVTSAMDTTDILGGFEQVSRLFFDYYFYQQTEVCFTIHIHQCLHCWFKKSNFEQPFLNKNLEGKFIIFNAFFVLWTLKNWEQNNFRSS